MNGTVLRIGIFVALVALLGLAEWCWPQHRSDPCRLRRWPINLGLGALNALCVRVLLPWLAVDAAIWASAHEVGVLHSLQLPMWLTVTISVIALDLVVYWQHRIMHAVGWLWRLHRVHHTDLALDVSSGVRFHPLEILLSMLIKIVAVITLGPPAVAVLGFEILLSSFALFTHANLRLPERLDTVLRWLIVTPDMHRIHHSVLRTEHDSNYGFHVSWWDRIFGSYKVEPAGGRRDMRIGLTQFRSERDQQFLSLLVQPTRLESATS